MGFFLLQNFIAYILAKQVWLSEQDINSRVRKALQKVFIWLLFAEKVGFNDDNNYASIHT